LRPIPLVGTPPEIFVHSFINPISGAPLMPFMVRVVLNRITAGNVTFTDSSTVPPSTFTWANSGGFGQEVDCMHILADGATDLPAFKYSTDFTSINVYPIWQTGLILPYMLPALGPAALATDYRMKVYATALNPAYVP
jgi:hypothetical protein